MEAHTVNTLTHKSGDCKPKMFNKYMPSEFSDAFSELFIDGIWSLPDGPGMLHSRPEHREKPSRKGKKPCLPDSAPKKKENSGIFNIPLLSETGSAHKHGDQNPGDFNTLIF